MRARLLWIVPVALLALTAATCQAPVKKAPPKDTPPADPCATDPVVVNPDQLCGWSTQTADLSAAAITSSVGFANGPDTPPLGTGSVQFAVGSDSDNTDDGAEIGTNKFNGMRLDELTALTYFTYIQSHPDHTGQTVYLSLGLDNDANGEYDNTLFFEPTYTVGAENVNLGEWQMWDAGAADAIWWHDETETPGTTFETIAQYLVVFPDATIIDRPERNRAGIRVVAGFGTGHWRNFVGNADAVTINGETFDFET